VIYEAWLPLYLHRESPVVAPIVITEDAAAVGCFFVKLLVEEERGLPDFLAGRFLEPSMFTVLTLVDYFVHELTYQQVDYHTCLVDYFSS
jgi:hypothetical protein